MEYRKDVDGLRAVAVLPVILFHAGFKMFEGGFLGVDIFFVISGFLITSILLIELKNDKFSIIGFYERRARRILPALFFVLFFTTLLSVIFLSPLAFKEYSQSLVSVTTFLSNVFFYSEINYFSPAAEEMPLLHTWSLAIEEQFYIVFPPLLFAMWYLGRRHLLLTLVVFTAISAASMLALNHLGHNTASFYWPISRAWELLAGSVIAYIGFANKNKTTNVKYVADISFLILLSCLLFWPRDLVHPGLLTTVPVLATCLLILYPNKNGLAYKCLSSTPVVFIGLISYSLYLWHQPLFALLRIKSFGPPSLLLTLSAIILTFVLAFYTYRYIETPFRNKRKYNRSYIFTFSGTLLCIFFVTGLSGHIYKGFPNRFDSALHYTSSIEFSPMRQKCHASDENYLQPNDACQYFEGNATWAIFGDSHSVEPAYALASLLHEKGVAISHHSYSACPPAINYIPSQKSLCSKWINDTLRYLENNSKLETVVVVFRYSAALFGDNIASYPSVPSDVVLSIDSETVLSDEDKLNLYWQNLELLIRRLLTANKKVILLEPIPELPIHIERGIYPFTMFGGDQLLNIDSATSKEYYHTRHNFILAKLRSLIHLENLHLVNVYDILCGDSGCPAVLGNTALYFDDDHLSVEGSKVLIKKFLPSRNELPISPPSQAVH